MSDDKTLSVETYCNLTDDHCSKLVELGVVKPLLQLLENPNRELDIKLGHAVLSALRNLSIPSKNIKS